MAQDGAASSARTLVLVAGSGRSGTSLLSGILQRLDFRVPQPEVPPDESNPRGFAESQWVVDFHTRLLETMRVQTADARPLAWAKTADVSAREEEVAALRTFMQGEYAAADNVVIKDPRLSWFLPMWRRCADDLAVTPRIVTMLRHPAAVVDSKGRYYGSWQTDIGRTAGWVNTMLFTERATREAPRIFIRYDDLLEDWTKVVARMGDVLDLAAIRDASAPALRRVHQFVDPALSRSSASWDDLPMPATLRDLAERSYTLLSRLADADVGDDEVAAITKDLDAARDEYVRLYEEAEGVAQSSVIAARSRRRSRKQQEATKQVSLSRRYRQKVPLQWRRAALRVLGRQRRPAS